MPRFRFALALAAVGLALPATAADLAPVVTSDVLRLKTAAELDVSRDGRRAVYVETSMVETEEGSGTYRYDHHLWLADLDPGAGPPRQMTFGERSDSSPTLSPDGSRIAFVRADGEVSQVWILPLAGGEAYPLTTTRHGADSPVWSPDGTRLLYRSDLPSWAVGEPLPWTSERAGRSHDDEPDWAMIRDRQKHPEPGQQPLTEPAAKPDGTLEEIRAWLARNTADGDPRVYDRLDLQGERDLVGPGITFSHLYSIAAQPGSTPVALTRGAADYYDGHWTPDGRTVVCQTTTYPIHPDRVQDSDIWVAAADGSGGHRLLD